LTVTCESGEPESETVKEKSVDVPALPSFALVSAITTLHSKRLSCRWFLSPQPLPGFVEVGVVVLVVEDDEVVLVVDELVLDDVVELEVVELEVVLVDVVVGVVVVVVEVLVVVGVVVVVVDVDVEQYWYCDGVVQYW
jgi:hypothetical protein